MTAGRCSRTLRAAVFAAVCVLLTSLGHTMMSGTAVPWWAMAAGAVVTGGAAWWWGGWERGPVLVGSATVVAQAVLHALFSLAQAVVQPESAGSGSLVQLWMNHLQGASHSGPGAERDSMATSMDSMGHMMGATHATHSMATTDGMDHEGIAHSLHQGMSGMSSTGMLAAHLLAALVCGLWLAHGERAAFRIVRALAGWLTAPLRLLLRMPVPPHRPQARARRDRSDRAPHGFLLTYAITSRGPPLGTAAVV
ncbi:hypothetical protein ACFC4C_01220 [Streptomyces sp. NPDC056039]|uniref:hypothetical protein n=1 Tax=Streptomyces sp. NPDC056039 TaxID=3345687 RepID=UPI0035E34D7D